MKLPADISRCAGRFDFMPDGKWCQYRDECARHQAFLAWDRKDGLPDYKRISVFMARPDCEDFIDAAGL